MRFHDDGVVPARPATSGGGSQAVLDRAGYDREPSPLLSATAAERLLHVLPARARETSMGPRLTS